MHGHLKNIYWGILGCIIMVVVLLLGYVLLTVTSGYDFLVNFTYFKKTTVIEFFLILLLTSSLGGCVGGKITKTRWGSVIGGWILCFIGLLFWVI